MTDAAKDTEPAGSAMRAAIGHLTARNLGEAEQVLRKIVERNPHDPDAHNNLGVALKAQGRYEEAIACYRRALDLRPDKADAWNNLGNALKMHGEVDAAIAGYRRAVELRPDHVNAHFNLGTALLERGETAQAIPVYRRLLELAPRHRDGLVNLGVALRRAGNYMEAIECYQRVLAVAPDALTAQRNLANLFDAIGADREAEASYRRALELDARDAVTWSSLGGVLLRLQRFDEAIAAQRRALSIDADCALAHLNLGIALLATGDFAAGWPEYEWRWRCNEFLDEPSRFRYPRPRWRGEDLAGRSILLHHEQGLGDSIQFIRYAALLARRAARVVAGVQPELVRLFRSIPGIEVITQGDEVPICDCYAYLASLPLAFGTTLETIPADVPYLHAEPARSTEWRRRLGPGNGVKVGLVWAGKPTYKRDSWRSLRLADFAPLAGVAGVSLHSLQLGAAASEALSPPAGLRLADWSGELVDFADTAALVANLDLVISVDTAPAHLAGALGKPVWLLSRHEGEWRWLTGREGSPWYPTMRIFRQQTAGDWREVIARVTAALMALVAGAANTMSPAASRADAAPGHAQGADGS